MIRRPWHILLIKERVSGLRLVLVRFSLSNPVKVSQVLEPHITGVSTVISFLGFLNFVAPLVFTVLWDVKSSLDS
jgi:hypothetical protein